MENIILIVDDNTENLKVLGNVLKEKGYKIAIAKSGLDAIQLLGNIKPSLILLDVMMPEMDGYETSRNIKKTSGFENIPIIFLTAKTNTEDIIHGFEAGGVDYVTKPFNSTELLARVKNHLELHEARETIKLQADQLKLYSEFLEVRLSSHKHEVQKLKEIIESKNTRYGNLK